MAEGSRIVVLAALAGNAAIAISKGVAFALTGSSAMLTEAIHSCVDTGNQGLLLLGMRRANRPPDERHPFGHGLEAYFWAFVVALMIFALGGAVSIWEGVHKLQNPEPIDRPWINYVVLGLAILFEGGSFAVAYREFGKVRRGAPFLLSIGSSKDPNIFAVLLEDLAALIGLFLALAGVTGSAVFGWEQADGLASIGIGLLLVGVAVYLANETRSLLSGEAASPRVLEGVRDALLSDGRVVRVADVDSMHLGPEEILLGVTLVLRDDLTASEVGRAAEDLTERLKAVDPRINRVFLRSGRASVAEAQAASP